ncbi:MAG: membrane protein insertion efficiency factor YidD [Nocardioidaceae bacterium]|nr:membrane protein insertion efficiency factor YidD [Nocardioidaceae bacterium]
MRSLLVLALRAYRYAISPLYGQVCRYHPTCSAYALDAVQTHGAARGSWLAARRVGRCHPWAEGGVDYVPGSEAEARYLAERADDPRSSDAPRRRNNEAALVATRGA